MTTLPDNLLSLSSEVLGLELRLEFEKLHLYDPATGQKLLTHEEAVAAQQAAVQALRQEQERAQRLAAKLRELNILDD